MTVEPGKEGCPEGSVLYPCYSRVDAFVREFRLKVGRLKGESGEGFRGFSSKESTPARRHCTQCHAEHAHATVSNDKQPTSEPCLTIRQTREQGSMNRRRRNSVVMREHEWQAHREEGCRGRKEAVAEAEDALWNIYLSRTCAHLPQSCASRAPTGCQREPTID